MTGAHTGRLARAQQRKIHRVAVAFPALRAGNGAQGKQPASGPAAASIQNISGLPKDLPSALWQAEREVDPDWCPGLLFYLLMTGLASREGLSWETLSGGII